MKRFFALVLVLILATAAAYADTTFWDNGALNGRTDRCDANTPTCLSTGWTVYDDFLVPNGIGAITGFSFVDQVDQGTWADYISTNWTLFNAANPFGTPTYSGTAVFTLTDLGNGDMQLSISGLNIPVTTGYWIVGFQNNMSNASDITERQAALGNGLPGYFQQDNTGASQFTLDGDTAFTVSGTTTPEPSTLLLLGSGLFVVTGCIRRRLRR